MGWIRMSGRDMKRIEVLSEVLAGRRTVATAASLSGRSEHQADGLLPRYKLIILEQTELA